PEDLPRRRWRRRTGHADQATPGLHIGNTTRGELMAALVVLYGCCRGRSEAAIHTQGGSVRVELALHRFDRRAGAALFGGNDQDRPGLWSHHSICTQMMSGLKSFDARCGLRSKAAIDRERGAMSLEHQLH